MIWKIFFGDASTLPNIPNIHQSRENFRMKSDFVVPSHFSGSHLYLFLKVVIHKDADPQVFPRRPRYLEPVVKICRLYKEKWYVFITCWKTVQSWVLKQEQQWVLDIGTRFSSSLLKQFHQTIITPLFFLAITSKFLEKLWIIIWIVEFLTALYI